jgi:hypothetical protein
MTRMQQYLPNVLPCPASHTHTGLTLLEVQTRAAQQWVSAQLQSPTHTVLLHQQHLRAFAFKFAGRQGTGPSGRPVSDACRAAASPAGRVHARVLPGRVGLGPLD